VPMQFRLLGAALMRVIYLHGFASSARSSKAAFLGARLAEQGIGFAAPDLNQPDFSTLTVTRMLGQAGEAIAAAGMDVVLVGSSLGGFVAVHAAIAHPSAVSRLVLLAPALDFGGNRMRHLGEQGLDEWRLRNRLDVFHYAYGRMMSVHYQLYTDARQYDALSAKLDIPIQVFQGTRDTSVDPESVREWSGARPNVELHLLDDDHQLGASLEYIWREMSRFISAARPT
jgi:uncharacterized protein